MKKNKIKHKCKYIEFADNGMVYYDSGLNKFTKEEVERLNKEYYEKQEKCIPKILEDGFIEFPIMHDLGNEILWGKAYLPPNFIPSCSEGFEERFGLKYNIYIPSYNRAGITLTNKVLDSYYIENYYFCIDPDQYEEYSKFYDKKHIIIRDPTFKSPIKTDLFSSVIAPDYLSGAAGAAFNPLLFLSKSLGEECYTTMDDDIITFGLRTPKLDTDINQKYNKDNFLRCSYLSLKYGFDFKEYWRDLERLLDSTRNVSMLAIEKYGLIFTRKINEFIIGSRAYSCYITKNKNVEIHSGQQNNDTITSMQLSQTGFPCIVVEGFQYSSLDTQSQRGGATNTYSMFGTLDKTKVLIQAQPQFAKISHLHNRIHHTCDYSFYRQRIVGSKKTL